MLSKASDSQLCFSRSGSYLSHAVRIMNDKRGEEAMLGFGPILCQIVVVTVISPRRVWSL